MYEYIPRGTCSSKIQFDIVEDKITNLQFMNGCPGNLLGISQLVEGMDIHLVIERFKGVHCGHRPTSCPDQLSKALEKWLSENPKN